jgi:hypothetical protein
MLKTAIKTTDTFWENFIFWSLFIACLGFGVGYLLLLVFI